MPVHNFLAHVKHIQDWRGRLAITTLHPETVISMPIILTTDTLELFDYIYSHKELSYNMKHHTDHNNHANALILIDRAKQHLISENRLLNTGGNKQIVRAMLYHAYNQNILVKDISYMWNTLESVQMHQCVNEPYSLHSENRARENNIDMAAAEHRIAVQQVETNARHRIAMHEISAADHRATVMQELDIRIDTALTQEPVRTDPDEIARIAEVLHNEIRVETARATHDDIVDAVSYYPGISGENIIHD